MLAQENTSSKPRPSSYYSAGYQGVLMAPTDILARQHYKFLSEFLKDYPISIFLLVASLTAKEKREV